MKSTTIKKIINGKVKKWVESIDDTQVQSLVRKNTIVTGGCIASMLLNEPVNDYDIYFRNKETTEAVANYYLKKFKEKHGAVSLSLEVTDEKIRIVTNNGHRGTTEGDVAVLQNGDVEDEYDDLNEKAQEVEDVTYRPVFISTNAITLSSKIQIVLRFFGEPEKIHEYFDFQHCTNYWTSWDGDLTLHPKALECLLSRELRYVGSKYPLCSLMRIRKFVKRGWTINAGQILKAAMQLNDMDLTDPRVLEDQLTGVDSAYFVQLIDKLKENDPERVNAAYLVEIVDRLF